MNEKLQAKERPAHLAARKAKLGWTETVNVVVPSVHMRKSTYFVEIRLLRKAFPQLSVG